MPTRILSSVLWCGLFLLLLFAPLVLVLDTNGETGFISRLDLVWVVLSSPEQFLQQTISGMSSTGIWRSCLLLLRTGVSLLLCWGIGAFAFRNIPPQILVAYSLLCRKALYVLIGFTLLGIGSFLSSVMFSRGGLAEPIAILSLAMLFAGAISCFARVEGSAVESIPEIDTEASLQASVNLREMSWQRRLLGISILVSGLLFVAGLLSCVQPLADREVNRYSWNSIFHHYAPTPQTVDGIATNSGRWIGADGEANYLINTIFRIDPIPRLWNGFDQILVASGPKASAVTKVADRYWTFQTGKLVSYIVMWSGFLVVVGIVARGKGELCSALLVSLLGSFPSFHELSFFARPETWLIGTIALTWFACLLSRSHRRLKWALLGAVALPWISYGIYLASQIHSIDSHPLESLFRFLGFSWIYPVSWIPTVAAGVLYIKKNRSAGWMFGLSFLAFALQAILLRSDDRGWVPFTLLQSGCVAVGILNLVSLGRGSTRFAGALLGLLTACLSMLAWPGIDHRILMPAEQILSELNKVTWTGEPSTSGRDTELNYSGELQRLWDENLLPHETRIALVGHWNLLSSPYPTIRMSPMELTEKSLGIEMFQRAGVDVIALVSPLGGGADESLWPVRMSPMDISAAKAKLDAWVRSRIDDGELEKIDWVTKNRDLVLYRVRRPGS